MCSTSEPKSQGRPRSNYSSASGDSGRSATSQDQTTAAASAKKAGGRTEVILSASGPARQRGGLATAASSPHPEAGGLAGTHPVGPTAAGARAPDQSGGGPYAAAAAASQDRSASSSAVCGGTGPVGRASAVMGLDVRSNGRSSPGLGSAIGGSSGGGPDADGPGAEADGAPSKSHRVSARGPDEGAPAVAGASPTKWTGGVERSAAGGRSVQGGH